METKAPRLGQVSTPWGHIKVPAKGSDSGSMNGNSGRRWEQQPQEPTHLYQGEGAAGPGQAKGGQTPEGPRAALTRGGNCPSWGPRRSQ